MNVTDEDLLLYHYRDGLSDSERHAIESALSTDAVLAKRLKSIVTQLPSLQAPETSIDPAMTARLHASLKAAVRAQSQAKARGRWFAPGFASDFTKPTWKCGIAFAASATALIAITAYFSQRGASAPEVIAAAPAQVSMPTAELDEFAVNPMRFERRLAWYLAETEQQLNEIHQVSASERSALLTRAMAQNRVIEKAADRAARTQYARTLRAFGPLLEEIRQEGIDTTELDAGVSQLKFELRVLQARLGASSALSRT
jgi:anti-sigma-K factor RskA